MALSRSARRSSFGRSNPRRALRSSSLITAPTVQPGLADPSGVTRSIAVCPTGDDEEQTTYLIDAIERDDDFAVLELLKVPFFMFVRGEGQYEYCIKEDIKPDWILYIS